MAWKILFDPEFEEWFLGQSPSVQVGVGDAFDLLVAQGPQLGRPHVDTLKGSRVANLKELRVRVNRAQYRILFAFDPVRRAFVLVGGDKGKDKRWYNINIPIAEERFERYLAKVMREKEQGE